MSQRVEIYKTETYEKSLKKFDSKVINQINKKVNNLLINPLIAQPLKYNHQNFCEIKIGSKYRVYCIKKQNKIGLLFILGPVLHHKLNYNQNKEYQKLFLILEEINLEFSKISNS